LQDFWSTEKERVYLVGVAYKQQYQQQQQQQQRRQQQQQGQRLFGSSNGGLAMSASSYSPWAAADADDGSSSSKRQPQITYNVHESLDELGRLAETAGLQVSPLCCCFLMPG
jgi:transcription initiation factor TFIID subunit TAF12